MNSASSKPLDLALNGSLSTLRTMAEAMLTYLRYDMPDARQKCDMTEPNQTPSSERHQNENRARRPPCFSSQPIHRERQATRVDTPAAMRVKRFVGPNDGETNLPAPPGSKPHLLLVLTFVVHSSSEPCHNVSKYCSSCPPGVS